MVILEIVLELQTPLRSTVYSASSVLPNLTLSGGVYSFWIAKWPYFRLWNYHEPARQVEALPVQLDSTNPKPSNLKALNSKALKPQALNLNS